MKYIREQERKLETIKAVGEVFHVSYILKYGSPELRLSNCEEFNVLLTRVHPLYVRIYFKRMSRLK